MFELTSPGLDTQEDFLKSAILQYLEGVVSEKKCFGDSVANIIKHLESRGIRVQRETLVELLEKMEKHDSTVELNGEPSSGSLLVLLDDETF